MARRLIDQNPRREVRRQGALLDRLTIQFRGRLKSELEAAMREMVSHWEQTGNVVLPRGFYDRIAATYQQMALASVTTFGSRVYEQGKSRGLDLETKETKESFAQIMRRLALRYIEQEAIRRRITEVTDTTRDQVIRAVRKGYEDGLGQRGTANYILDLVPQIADYRANMIARTETHGAANFGSQEAAKQTGLPMKKQWLATADDRTRDTHRAADGDTVGMDDTFRVGDSDLHYPGDPAGAADEVINCFHPDTMILTAGLKRGIRRNYIGQLIKMSFGGPINLTVTPNHPILTDRGWVAAGKIVKGDNLIHSRIANDREMRSSSDVNDGYISAQELYDSGKNLRLVAGSSGVVVNFHGEVVTEQVDIVSFNGSLRDRMKTFGNQLFGQFGFTHADIVSGRLLANRMLGLSNSISADFADCFMSISGSGNALTFSHQGSGPLVAFGNTQTRKAKLFKNGINHSPRKIEFLSDAVDGMPSIEQFFGESVIANSNCLPSNSNRAFELLECTSIETFHYDGPVYNFESDTGLLISNGIVNHNCRCALGYIIDEEAFEAML
jgi:hypothetical protein